MPPGYTAADEENARQALLDRRGHLTRNIFAGTKLEFTNTFIALSTATSAKNAYTIAKETKTLVTGGIQTPPGSVENLVNGVFNTNNLNSLMSEVGVPATLTHSVDHFLSILPGVASLQSGLAAMNHLRKWCSHAWDKYQVESKTGSFRCGDPRAAMMAIREVIERAKKVQASQGLIEFSHAAASAGGVFIDGGAFTGPAAAALKAFASFTYRMYLLARDFKEKKRANLVLKDPSKVDSDIFKLSPILGCYLITEGTAFDLVNFLVSEIGQAEWMAKVDVLLPDLVYIQDLAAQYARNADMQLSGLKTDMWNFRGLTRMERLKRWLKKKVSR